MTQTVTSPRPPRPGAAAAPGTAGPAASDLGRLLASCVDRPGIVSAITAFLHDRGANITQYDQETTDPVGGRFFQRLVFHLPGLRERLPQLEREFGETVAPRFGMTWRMRDVDALPRVALFVSRYDHCLLDLLWRWRRGEFPIDIVQVVSNHPDLAEAVAGFGVPYAHIPVTRATKPEAEQAQLDLLRDRVDLVVLARYMQILSGDLLDRIGVPVINIHHSFLPAFAGASPYDRARERGVKLIGATAHYATEDLDEGPIIEQDVIRVSHRHNAADLVRLGADIERTVLARAVRWHCEDRVMVNGRTTIVF
ncbi:formyltetrahydrofolate deformylase [Pseudonocardia benzenivorans]|uniref:Formyltetrahydrofolate deformylase n=2 Tax=Pseudonocardia TaxID=1847 RepID=F4CLL1_PSEUX|nr:formyltetrahydrofolate deformylase [Pseudonocardia dioxanivorans]AEA27064.1 formyltetrahydrofolate deformylase [Pseudonocardia dioxanivorans CB1190]GJF07905.1 formyltetrahydrofolate deformylase [Pseudonocardia sp. D17]